VRRSHRSQLFAATALVALLAAACGGDDDDDSGAATTAAAAGTTAAPGTTAAASGTTAAPGTTTGASEPAGTNAPEEATIRFALDWTPNTNHTGLYVARAEGYFEEAGINVEILPYNATSPDILVGTGAAECGISFHASMTFSRAAGTPIKSVMAVLQHDATGIGVRADRDDIASPKDLDGMTYAGFGTPGEKEAMAQVIKNDGGKGEFDVVTLSTAAYEAVYAGEADFTEPFYTWEGIEAELRGTPFKIFKPQDYGFPDEYTVVVICNEPWMAENEDATRRFLGALKQGYEFAMENPEESGQILIDENPGAFSEEELVFQSQDLLSSEFYPDASGEFGTQTLEQWTAYSKFLYDSGLLTDADGNALTEEPDYSTFFTNDYISTG
jgi:ABC-type nitrate/sulfonate/bicarbonate transport system substrate-binding protein